MSSLPQTQPRITAEEYLARERQAEHKSEFLDGRIYALAGASRRHNLIAGNVYAEIHAPIRGRPCEAYVSDMRVKISPTVLCTYPDVVALCDERQARSCNGRQDCRGSQRRDDIVRGHIRRFAGGQQRHGSFSVSDIGKPKMPPPRRASGNASSLLFFALGDRDMGEPEK